VGRAAGPILAPCSPLAGSRRRRTIEERGPGAPDSGQLRQAARTAGAKGRPSVDVPVPGASRGRPVRPGTRNARGYPRRYPDPVARKLLTLN
jgi:hypothetical protein